MSINFNHQLNKGHMHNIYGCDVNFVISCVWSILYDVIITILFWDQWELNYWSQLIKIYFKIYFNISCLGMKFAKRFNYQCQWDKKLVKKIIEGLETSKHDHVKRSSTNSNIPRSRLLPTTEENKSSMTQFGYLLERSFQYKQKVSW